MPSTPDSERNGAVLTSVMEALAAGATAITANNRAAGWLRDRYDAAQTASGRMAWPTPRILPWPTWIRALWLSLRGNAAGAGVQVLTPWQERRLWSAIIAASADYPNLQNANASALAASAWEIVHGWQGQWAQWGGAGARDEHRAFVAWSAEFVRQCAKRQWIDVTRLPLLLVDALRSAAPGAVSAAVFYGFAEFSPQQQALLAALESAGVHVAVFDSADAAEICPAEGAAIAAGSVRCLDPADEWRRCAQWCRDQLARDANAALGVVIPDLAAQRAQVERIFTEALAPGALLGDAVAPLPFNISHAEPLARQPLVAAALSLLRWSRAPAGCVEIGALAHTPYLGGHAAEWAQRAQVVRDLAGHPRAEWRPLEFMHFVRARCPLWAASLSRWIASNSDWRQRRTAKEWRLAWEDALQAAEWLAGVTLDSAGYQARAAWEKLLGYWMRAESISGRMSAGEALSSLEHMASETAYQPERATVPVQILGTLEAAGLQFDALWICGLTAERWPPAPQPSPLLPLAWQRAVQAPHASAERELRYHRQLTVGFAAAAPYVVFSWPAAIDGVPALPSPLLAEFARPLDSAALPDAEPSLSLRMAHPGALSAWEDAMGVPLEQGAAIHGRVALVEAQANCPFQAYAAFRLGTEPWPERSEGLTPAERGSLVHAALAEFWKALPDQAALLALESDEWTARCERAVAAALTTIDAKRWDMLGDAFRTLERERLLGLLREWLDLEAARPDFTVVGTELPRTLTIDGLELRLKVDRIDNVGDNLVVIDFKTGTAAVADLLREQRLIAPQLPLYAEALQPGPVNAVAYATIRRGASRVAGIGATRDIWPALKLAEPDWPSTRARWSAQLLALVGEYRRGVASVLPWRYPATCDRCGRHALCRINEHVAHVVERDRRAVDSHGDGDGDGEDA